ncbi:hypothetical protein BB558_003223 [Smittium angustum]|uniref:Late endosomal/lysosomal adaptor and MAPK and MTOR activator 5 n=1 Tax=Smittium angustum TaxID=133377 RepID=A0A2U1J6Q4_SMIAN|nr:hypothetical protein BB558_003223 [Smittium angustum]
MDHIFSSLCSVPNTSDVVVSTHNGQIIKQSGDSFEPIQIVDASMLVKDAAQLLTILGRNSSQSLPMLRISVIANPIEISITPSPDHIYIVCKNTP